MTDVEAALERWRANCRAAGVRLTEADIAQARATNGISQVLEREALIANIGAAADLPDYLDRGALEHDDHA
jgi:hypothetical protein